jgi:5-methylcytosine-specific restriction endonuclease McrA
MSTVHLNTVTARTKAHMTIIARYGSSEAYYKHIRAKGAEKIRLKQEALDLIPFEDLTTRERFRRVKKQKFCSICNLTDWLDKPITLEVDHKDGNSKNHSEDNLWMLCPNCHSQTPNFRGRKVEGVKPEPRKRISDEMFIKALKTHSTIEDAISSVGLKLKGPNYRRAYKLLQQIISTGP